MCRYDVLSSARCSQCLWGAARTSSRKKRRKKMLPRSFSRFACAARPWKSGNYSTSPLPGTSCSVSASCQRVLRRAAWFDSGYALVSEALGFLGFPHEGGPRFLGRFSSLSCVLASPEEYKNIGSPFSVLCWVRRWIHAHARQCTEPLDCISHLS